jgi:hypothetical protein
VRVRLVGAVLLAAAVGGVGAGCADSDPGPIPLACDGVIRDVPGEPALHVPVGSPIEWSTNPPATGMHFGVWAKWDHHYPALDRGFWLHNAEHGGIILLYRCPDGCPDVVDALLDLAGTFAGDPACAAPVRNRLIVAADPLLPAEVQVAAVGWNATYTASCFDPYIRTFAAARYRKGPEDLCTDGASLGGTFIDPR